MRSRSGGILPMFLCTNRYYVLGSAWWSDYYHEIRAFLPLFDARSWLLFSVSGFGEEQ